MKEFHVVRLGEDGKLEFDRRPKLEIIHGKCSEFEGRMYKRCKLTYLIEPAYAVWERLVRWAGCKLNIESLCYYHQKSPSHEFSFESIEGFRDCRSATCPAYDGPVLSDLGLCRHLSCQMVTTSVPEQDYGRGE